MIRVALVASVIPHYRLPVVHAVNRLHGMEWHVVTTGGGAWATAQAGDTLSLPRVHVLAADAFGPKGAQLVFYRGLRHTLDAISADAVVAEPRMGLLSVMHEALSVRPRRRRLVWWMAGWRDADRAAWKTTGADVARRFLVRRADAAACYGTRAAARAVELGLPAERVVVAQNAIETVDLEAAVDAARATAGRRTAADGLRVLFIGQLIRRKRLDLLFRAMAGGGLLCRSTTARIVGNGPDRERLVALTHRIGIADRVEWYAGSVDPAELAKHAVWANVAVNPHAGGLGVNTYMAAGLPVICGEADGTEDDLVIGGVTGWRSFGQEWSSLAACLEEAGDRRSDLVGLGQAARDHLHSVASVEALADGLARAVRLALS